MFCKKTFSTGLALVRWLPLQLELLQQLLVEVLHCIVPVEIRLPPEVFAVADEAGKYCEVFARTRHHRRLQKLDDWKIATKYYSAFGGMQFVAGNTASFKFMANDL